MRWGLGGQGLSHGRQALDYTATTAFFLCTVFQYVGKADIKHADFLPKPPKHWEYRQVSPSSKWYKYVSKFKLQYFQYIP